ncbi:uncharacterized protein LOC130854432 [Hippopotamus amphibius kiboko]|uniref:uncharacterized protein LOC130854432 n=1 Tax=Hippopotamus amphibius kiboko TaxID=575201 RepID=UPI002595C390|nr:uncharacterized protein LOC130854432 [Hippopotamus amphibius kiboko]
MLLGGRRLPCVHVGHLSLPDPPSSAHSVICLVKNSSCDSWRFADERPSATAVRKTSKVLKRDSQPPVELGFSLRRHSSVGLAGKAAICEINKLRVGHAALRRGVPAGGLGGLGGLGWQGTGEAASPAARSSFRSTASPGFPASWARGHLLRSLKVNPPPRWGQIACGALSSPCADLPRPAWPPPYTALHFLLCLNVLLHILASEAPWDVRPPLKWKDHPRRP